MSLERDTERERQRRKESERVLSPAPQTCVTNPQGAGGRSVQDQSAAPQQERSTLSPFPHTVHECVCVTVLYVCDHGVGTEVTAVTYRRHIREGKEGKR